jgi:leucyl-tRNA synthetase
LHLMYARYITMVLFDAGIVDFQEPFSRVRAHGTIIKDGAKMSKSRGNVVVPDEYIGTWGADTFRMYLMFLGPYLEGGDFRDEGISGIRRFLDKVWSLIHENSETDGVQDRVALRALHQTIRKVTDDIEGLHYNTAISALMEYVNVLRSLDGQGDAQGPALAGDLLDPLVTMLAPFAPHFAEECWERLGHEDARVFDATWPSFDADLAREEEVELVVQVNGKVRGKVQVTPGISEADAIALAVAEPGVKRHLDGREIRKAVYVQDRLVSLVV